MSKALDTEDISLDQLDNFLIFLEMFDLPPFLGGFTLVEYLDIVVSGKLGHYLKLPQQSAIAPDSKIGSTG